MSDALPSPFRRDDLAERIAKAKNHMAGYRQHNEALWPHQPFCVTVSELLDAAERGLKAAEEITRLRAEAASWEQQASDRIDDALQFAAERDAMREAAQQALVALVHHTEQTRPIQRTADAIAVLRAALSAPLPAVPAGMALVPVEPTPEMEQAMADSLGACVKAWAVWRDVLAAAPQAPTQAPTADQSNHQR